MAAATTTAAEAAADENQGTTMGREMMRSAFSSREGKQREARGEKK